MGNSFTSKKKEKVVNNQPTHCAKPIIKVTENDKVKLELKNTRDSLNKYKKRLSIESDKLYIQIKELLAKDRGSGISHDANSSNSKKALTLLKIKKNKEKVIDSLDGKLQNILTIIDNVEMATMNAQVYETMKDGSELLKKLNAETPLDQILELLDDLDDQYKQTEEVTSLLSKSLLGESDESTILEEIEQLRSVNNVTIASSTATSTDTAAAVLPTPIIFPIVPTTTPVISTVDDTMHTDTTASASSRNNNTAIMS